MFITRWKISDIFVYLLAGPLIFIWHYFDRTRLMYALPFLLCFLVLLNNLISKKMGRDEDAITVNSRYIWGFILYLFIAFLSIIFPIYENITDILVLNKFRADTVVRDIIILGAPLLIFSFNIKYTHKHIVYLFFVSLCSFFAIVGFRAEVSFLSNILHPGESGYEFHEGIVFGLFFLYFLRRRSFALAAITLVLILLANKRAILLGLIPAISMYWLILNPIKISNDRKALYLFFSAYFLVFFFISVNFDSFTNYLITKVLDKSRFVAHEFLMARDVFINGLNGYIYNNSFIRFLLGNGPGQADTFLQETVPSNWYWMNKVPVNPHNDFLKLQFDYGVVGVIGYMVTNIIMYTRTQYGILCFLYTIPVMMVDNPLIFLYYLLYAGFISNVSPDEAVDRLAV